MRINSIQNLSFMAKKPVKSRYKTTPCVDKVNPTLNQDQMNALYDSLNISRVVKDELYKYKQGASSSGSSSLDTIYLYVKNLNFRLENLTSEIEGKK